MDNITFLKRLQKLGACPDAYDWCKQHGGTFAELWRDCERGDWMNWYLVKDQKYLGITKQQLVGALADITKTVAVDKATEQQLAYVANAAANTTYAIADADADAAYVASLKRSANIFRKHFPFHKEVA